MTKTKLDRFTLKRKNQGFSLVELMAAVIILGILAGGAAIAINGQIKKARLRAAQSELSTLSQAIELFDLECAGLPNSLNDLIQKPSGCPSYPAGGFLKKKEIPTDPWGNMYEYAKNGVNNPDGFDLWSFGPDKEDGTVDDVTNWASADNFDDE